MFTGIVQGMAKVLSIEEKSHFRSHAVELPAAMLAGLEPGSSVANNGCCLTYTCPPCCRSLIARKRAWR